MPQIDVSSETHLLAALVLFSRLGDVVSTWLVTPRLRLEANPVVRRLGWRFAALTLFVAFVPYAHAGLGVAILTTSLFVTASNLSRGWMVRAMGEAEYEHMLLDVARRGSRREALAFVNGGAAFILSAGLVLIWLDGPVSWGFWFGFGIITYAFAISVHGSFFIVRTFRRAAQSNAT